MISRSPYMGTEFGSMTFLSGEVPRWHDEGFKPNLALKTYLLVREA